MDIMPAGTNPYISIGSIYSMAASGAGNKEIAREFNSVFMQTMLKEIFKSQSADGLFGDSPSGGFYTDMMKEQLIAQLAAADAFGIEKMVKSEIGEDDKDGGIQKNN